MKKFKAFVVKILKIFLPDPVIALPGEPVFTREGLFKKLSFYGSFFLAAIAALLIPALIADVTERPTRFALLQSAGDTPSLVQMAFLFLCLIILLLMPFLRFVTKWIPVTGALFVFAEGYVFAYTIVTMKAKSLNITILCVILVIIVAITPYFAYTRLDVRLPLNTAKVVYIAFWINVFGGSVLTALTKLPVIGDFFYALVDLGEYRFTIIILAIIQVIIPLMFLILAYEQCVKYIELKVKKSMEWAAFFAIIYTTLRMYEAMLDLFKLFAGLS